MGTQHELVDSKELATLRRLAYAPTSQVCRETQVQNCHACNDLTCGDNMAFHKPFVRGKDVVLTVVKPHGYDEWDDGVKDAFHALVQHTAKWLADRAEANLAMDTPGQNEEREVPEPDPVDCPNCGEQNSAFWVEDKEHWDCETCSYTFTQEEYDATRTTVEGGETTKAGDLPAAGADQGAD